MASLNRLYKADTQNSKTEYLRKAESINIDQGVVHFDSAHWISEYLTEGSESEVLRSLASERKEASRQRRESANLPKGVKSDGIDDIDNILAWSRKTILG
jgi:hypothetical protein